MTSAAPQRGAGPRNFYVSYLNHSRWLSPHDLNERRKWFDALTVPHKADLLFRFETLLKGLCCMGNPVHFSGETPYIPGEDNVTAVLDMQPVVALWSDVLTELVDLGIALGAGETRASPLDVFCSELFLPEHERLAHTQASCDQSSPAASLDALVFALHGLQEIVVALGEKDAVSYRQFAAANLILLREVQRSRYFNVLGPLEFRSQYDAIANNTIIATLSEVDNEPARRVVTIVFIAVFRLLRILDELDQFDPRAKTGPVYTLLAALRYEANALADVLTRSAKRWMATDFSSLFSAMGPEEITARYDELDLLFAELKSLKEVLESTGAQLQLETKKAFVHQLPGVFEAVTGLRLSQALHNATTSLRSFLHNAVVLCLREFRSNITGDELFANFTSDVTRSIRLRRDVWMFRQILKAFITKAKSAEQVGDTWSGLDTFRYVRTFVRYFRSMGYQLLRYSDYDRFDKFMALVDRLQEGDALEVQRISHVLEECEAFYAFLDTMFTAINQRRELADVPFDAKDAARTLKLFIE